MFDENSNAASATVQNGEDGSGSGSVVAAAASTSPASTNIAAQLLNVKDSRWLQVEVCREFQRGQCARSDVECKFAHPPPHVDVQQGRVTACYDSIKGRCTRENPKCKYLHPPQHIKDQLLINGRNNLALKNLLCSQMTASAQALPVNHLAIMQQQQAAQHAAALSAGLSMGGAAGAGGGLPYHYYNTLLYPAGMMSAASVSDPYQQSVPKRPTVDKNGGLVFPGGSNPAGSAAAAAAAASAYPYHLLAAGGLQGYVPAVSCEFTPPHHHPLSHLSPTVSFGGVPPHNPHAHHPSFPPQQPHLFVDCSVAYQQ
ncbi:hypothetical protein PENTCL1PPCAC_25109 [Pristionchus entomophagus]|uniref:Muscleblind-like protein n=1 Tax=Pristionchus entomophagus TaxID=358040 RepID=A0AAV5U981_9BILA|nr:hypothetical protein PENTCL1PPCAC_25109 [Pristionchus entomophagus]